jgi:hypothetical protein
VIKVLTQRPIPKGFDTHDDNQVARGARMVVDAMAAVGVRMHWMCTYVTDDSLFGVVDFETEGELKAFQLSAGRGVAMHRITRTIDPSSARG